MRIHNAVRLLVGLVFVATLPTGSAQPKGGACSTDANCGIGSCCKVDLTCSLEVRGTIIAGKSAEDACECASQVLDTGTGLCGCGDDSHCAGTRCCTANGTCSKKGVGTILPGRTASDACECTSGGIAASTGRCRCIDANIDCDPNKCCKADDICSTRDRASILAGMGASDECECASGNINTKTGKCECADDSHCSHSKCCTADGSCSKRDMGSVPAGKIPDDACECGSGVIIRSTGKCRCTDDAHCEGDKCCGANGICSRRSGASVLVGKKASDACECADGRYDPVTKRCGCASDDHCARNTCCKADFTCSTVDVGSILSGEGPAEDACECVTGQYDADTDKCVCIKNSDCAGDTCCKDDQTCSKKDLASVKPGGTASDACECSTSTYSAKTGQCQCKGDGDCPGDKCCGVNNVCSAEDEATVPAGIAATDACECVRKAGYSPGPTPGTGVCGCTESSHCPANKCCTADGSCSKKDVASVKLGGKASDACECASGSFKADTGKCVCGDDSFCAGDTCCREDGRCSARDKASVPPGFIGNDACECASGVHIPGVTPSKDRCGCKDDTDCKQTSCCMEDGRCSARKKESVSPGVIADDKCECLSLSYDPSRGVCG